MNRDDALRILTEHRHELHERYGLKSLALFGSVARNEASETSDVDVLVEFDRPVTLFDLVAVQQALETLLNVPKVDVVMRDSIYPAIKKDVLEEAVDMKCVICKMGEIHPGRATVTLNRGATTIIIKDVPADVCDNCGEYYLSEEMTSRILLLAEDAMRKGAEIEVLRWAA